MEAEACAADPPVVALGFRGVKEPWVPDERDDDGSPVDQVYGETIGCEVNVLDSFSRSNFRTVNFLPPSVFSRVPLIVAVRAGVLPQLNPRLSASRIGCSQNFADWSSRSTWTWGGSFWFMAEEGS